MEIPAGWQSDVQTREVEESLYVLSGTCAIITNSEKVIGTAGTIIYIPAGETHQHHNIGDQTFSSSSS
jgi:quercetin dioxygenase-like cupin family protein